MVKLSELASPALAGVIREKTRASAKAEINNCVYDGADMIDLHMSCLENPDKETLAAIIGASRLPVLALNYNNYADWSPRGYTEDEREELFLRAAEAGAAGIDMQGYTFDAESRTGFHGEDKHSFTKNGPKEVVTDTKVIDRQCAFIERIHSMGAEVLLSCHPGIPMSADAVTELALFLEKRSPDIIKIVTRADSEEDLIESFKAMSLLKREVKTKVAYHANGNFGSLSRIVNPALGGHIAFCIDRFSDSSTFGQLDLRTARAIIDGMKKIQLV